MVINQFKSGNILMYVGRLGQFFEKKAKIISVEPTKDDKDGFLLKVKEWNGKEHEIWAYDWEIWPVTVTPGILEEIGFARDERNVFKLEETVLIRPIFIKGQWPEGQYIDKGFVAVEKKLALPLKEEEVDAFTVPVTSLHALQNYLEGKIVKKIDWSEFL